MSPRKSNDANPKPAWAKRLLRMVEVTGMSHRAFCEKAGVSVSYLSQVNRGDVKSMGVDQAAKLVAAANEAGVAATVEWLVGGTGIGPDMPSDAAEKYPARKVAQAMLRSKRVDDAVIMGMMSTELRPDQERDAEDVSFWLRLARQLQDAMREFEQGGEPDGFDVAAGSGRRK